MREITIPGQIVNGHLQHARSLTELEGQHVIATLTVVPTVPANAKEAAAPKETHPEEAEFDPDPPPWLEIEHDLYFPMTVPSISLGKVKVRVEEGKPCIILPEELPDD
jgi:hypothetical protein